MDEEKEYIIPPRLNKKYLLYGFTIGELIFSVGAGVISIVLHIFWMLPIAAIVVAVSWRAPTTEKNAIDTIKMLYRFYGKPQQYLLRECDRDYEINQST